MCTVFLQAREIQTPHIKPENGPDSDSGTTAPMIPEKKGFFYHLK
jgi:hypothetical protein